MYQQTNIRQLSASHCVFKATSLPEANCSSEDLGQRGVKYVCDIVCSVCDKFLEPQSLETYLKFAFYLVIFPWKHNGSTHPAVSSGTVLIQRAGQFVTRLLMPHFEKQSFLEVNDSLLSRVFQGWTRNEWMSDSLCLTVACQAHLSMGFSRQEYWNELPFPPPGDLPDPGIKPMSPVAPAS